MKNFNKFSFHQFLESRDKQFNKDNPAHPDHPDFHDPDFYLKHPNGIVKPLPDPDDTQYVAPRKPRDPNRGWLYNKLHGIKKQKPS
jgi:hypothetical protein